MKKYPWGQKVSELLKKHDLRFEIVEDIHRHIASIMYGVEPGEVTTSQRSKANAENFPYLYVNSLSYADAVPLMEAQARAFAAAREKAESEGGA
jgi:DNA polymerase I-like protein with 3'-5' exonuclease and polymerase domains